MLKFFSSLKFIRLFIVRALFKIKRVLINKLGVVSDQYFYLDSYMVPSRQDGLERLGLYSSQSEVEFIAPANGKAIKSFFIDRYVYRLFDPTVDPRSGFIYDNKGVFIAESSAWNLLRGFYSWPKPFIRTPKKKLIGEYIYIDDIGYGHWLLEDLPAFIGAYKHFPNSKIICPTNPPSFLKYFLELLDNEIFYIDSSVSVEKLIMAGKSAGYGHPTHGLSYNPIDVENLRNFFKNYISEETDNNSLIFASRFGETRCPMNIKEIENLFISKGYTILNTEMKLTLIQQIKLFSSAKKVVGFHGAALMNLVWCNSGTEVVELFASEHMPTCFPSISSIRSLKYSWLNYGEFCEDEIDISKLEQIV